MTNQVPYWWSKDARAHTDYGRCGNCGHARGFHENKRGSWAGACTGEPIDAGGLCSDCRIDLGT